MNSIKILIILLVFVFLFGCTSQLNDLFKGIGVLSGSKDNIYTISYFEILKNTTSGQYFAYFIITSMKEITIEDNDIGNYKIAQTYKGELEYNLTIAENEVSSAKNIYTYGPISIKGSEYVEYYSRIPSLPKYEGKPSKNKYIGNAIIIPLPDNITEAKSGYITAELSVYIAKSGIGPVLLKSNRVYKIVNIVQVK